MEDGMKVMVEMLITLIDLEKPLVVLVRGAAFGIACTMIGLADFVYATEEAVFCTPFMDSNQSPEGTSTILFPKLFGPRKANEMLLLDKVMTAKEAEACGFINGVIKDMPKGDNVDFSKIPAIEKIL